MIHDSERELTFKRSAERSRRSHDAIDRLWIKGEDVEQPFRPHRYYHSTRHRMQPVPPILASDDQESSARQPSPQELAERAAVILALNVTSGKKSNPS